MYTGRFDKSSKELVQNVSSCIAALSRNPLLLRNVAKKSGAETRRPQSARDGVEILRQGKFSKERAALESL